MPIRLLISTLAMPLAACSVFAGEPPKADRSSGPLAAQSFQWSAAAGIELATGPAVPIRAYMESRMDAQTMGSLEYVYPGFTRAVTKPADDGHDLLTSNLWPDDDRGPVDNPPVGDNLLLIQSIDQAGATTTATLCNFRYRMALENENGSFSSVAGTFVHDDGIDALRVVVTAPAGTSDSLPSQSGQAVAPTDDVFGDWKITGLLTSWFTADPQFTTAWPTFESDLAKCVADAPDSPERRAFLIKGEHPRGDFPTSPPSPGWPEAAE